MAEIDVPARLAPSFADLEAQVWASADAVFLSPEEAELGFRVAVGDVNADGFDDLLASATGWGGNGYAHAGGAWFILGGGI